MEDLKTLIPDDILGQVVPSDVQKDAPVQQTQPVVQPTEPAQPVEQPKVEDKPAPKQDNAAFAQMRIQNKKYEEALSKIAKQQGKSLEEVINEVQVEADKKEAAKRGIDPDIQRQLRELQDQANFERQERQRERFLNSVTTLRSELNLSKEDVYGFVDQAAGMGINLMESQVPLNVLYKAINYDKLVQQQLEKAKQAWLQEDATRSNKSPETLTTRSRSNNSNIKTMEDALKDIFGN